jgi:hypothetical protein
MKLGVRLEDAPIEGRKTDVAVPTMLCVDRGGERKGIRQLQCSVRADGRGSFGEGHVNLDRLHVEVHEHLTDTILRALSGRCDEDLRVVDGADPSLDARLRGGLHPTDGFLVVGVVSAEEADQHITVEDD